MVDFKDIYNKLLQLKQYVENDLFEIIGTEGVNHFKNSFQLQGFTDRGLQKWPNVKRKDSNSSWYGFKYKATGAKPNGKGKNFSAAATQRPILTGATGDLGDSIQFRSNRSARLVTFFSDLPYAKLHNEGGPMKVFGKANATMPKRQFIGKSQALIDNIQCRVDRDINNILK